MVLRNYRFNPQRAMHQFRDELNRLFNDVVSDGGHVWNYITRGEPALNVWETEDAVMVEAELPGVKSQQLDIAVVGNELTLKVERSDPQPEGAVYHRRERPEGAFTRVVRLPLAVDPDRVTAELRNGVLLVKLPKADSAKPRKIQVVVS